MNRRGFSLFANVPAVTKNLIIINVLLWIATLYMSKIDLTSLLGLHYWECEDFRPHQLISYMFMHSTGSMAHIFFNMFAVFMFGRVLESEWGPKRFLTYYMITGIGAGLIQIFVAYLRIRGLLAEMPPEAVAMVYRDGLALMKEDKQYTYPMVGQLNALLNSTTVGASGSVFGILLAFGMMFPNMPLYLIPFPFPIKAKYMVIGYSVIELFLGVANFSGDRVAHFAHLGGMLFGIILVLYWRKKDRSDGKFFY